jgi:hypothetical protein
MPQNFTADPKAIKNVWYEHRLWNAACDGDAIQKNWMAINYQLILFLITDQYLRTCSLRTVCACTEMGGW